MLDSGYGKQGFVNGYISDNLYSMYMQGIHLRFSTLPNACDGGGCTCIEYDGENDGRGGECSGYADEVSWIEADNPLECEAIADSDENITYWNYSCDAEMHCVDPGCYQFDNIIEWQENSENCDNGGGDDDYRRDHTLDRIWPLHG